MMRSAHEDVIRRLQMMVELVECHMQQPEVDAK